jgi:hypothetical protein
MRLLTIPQPCFLLRRTKEPHAAGLTVITFRWHWRKAHTPPLLFGALGAVPQLSQKDCRLARGCRLGWMELL